MATLVHDSGNYYLQIYDGNKVPKRKHISLGTKGKKVAQKLKRRYEEAFALGEYDPWTGRKFNDPEQHLSVRDALQRFLKVKRQQGCTENTSHAPLPHILEVVLGRRMTR